MDGDNWPLAYLITIRCHGGWLHGDERGSVDRDHNRAGTPVLPPNYARWVSARGRMETEAVILDSAQRALVDAAVREVGVHRGWTLLAVNVRSNHVHLVVSARTPGKTVINALKAWSTRALRGVGHFRDQSPWARGGSARCLWTQASVERACEYVLEAQDGERFDSEV
jgi:REP element-mobilizing transposase RayT